MQYKISILLLEQPLYYEVSNPLPYPEIDEVSFKLQNVSMWDFYCSPSYLFVLCLSAYVEQLSGKESTSGTAHVLWGEYFTSYFTFICYIFQREYFVFLNAQPWK